MDVERYYDDFASRYDARRDEPYHRLLDEVESDVVAELAGAKGRVLEVGCGTGRVLKLLEGRVGTVVGVDLSRQMLLRARARGIGGIQGEVGALPFASESFDVVCSFKVLAHVRDLTGALEELGRVVAPGGAMVFDLYNRISLRWLVKRLVGPRRTGVRVTESDVPTRWDLPWDVGRVVPSGMRLERLRGVRVVTPAAAVLELPLVGPSMVTLERWLARRRISGALGGFIVAVVRKG